jgi:hypothetical protein
MVKDKNELIKTYATQSPEEMAKEQDLLEAEDNRQTKILEECIRDFSTKIDNMEVDGRILAIVQRPTSAQFKRFTPQSLAKYGEKPSEIPYDIAEKYEADMYKLMAELIIRPKHDAEWWKENTGDEFMAAFQAHLFKVRQKLQEDIKRFLPQT